jgi:hypothetical protein
MMTLGEAAGLNIHGLNPQLRQVIGRLSDNRPVILARAPWATYTNIVGGQTIIMSFVFPSFSLAPGDMIGVKLFGTGLNNTGAASSVGVTAQAVQGSTTAQLGGGIANVPTNAAQYGWTAELLFSINIPGAKGNYVPNISASAVTTGGTYSTGNQSLTGIGFTGGGSVFVSDTSATGPVFAGGKIVPTAGVNGAAIGSRITPIPLDPSLPIELDILLVDVSGARSISVNAGVMEGL